MAKGIVVPRFYKPRPYQLDSWKRRMSDRYNFYIKLWSRQSGKDTDDIECSLYYAWQHPGTRTAYVGLDNKWVNENIFHKYIDGREFWDDFPDIDPRETAKEVVFSNNSEGLAPARMKYIGFQNDQALIGSSYDRFVISEASLYQQDAFQFIEPIWENKLANGDDLAVWINGTPRGMSNVYTKMIQNYTGVDDPEGFPGEHVGKRYRVYVDKKTIEDLYVYDKETGKLRRLYSDEDIELMAERYRKAGLYELFRQEYYCDFTTVNSGLVYKGIEELRKDGRVTKFALDSKQPVYVAFDISSKAKTTDATAGIVYQYVNNKMMVYDMIEERGLALVQVIAMLATRDYWPLVRIGFLPWDSDRSASSETPIEEARRMFPQVNWHALDKERVDRGIDLVRQMLPNMVIHKVNCERLDQAFDAYEYKRLEKADDWSPKPLHNWASHAMDGLRYSVMGLKEMEYLGIPADGSTRRMPSTYGGFYDDDDDDDGFNPIWATEEQRRSHGRRGGSYYG